MYKNILSALIMLRERVAAATRGERVAGSSVLDTVASLCKD